MSNKDNTIEILQNKLNESEQKFKLLFERAPLSYQSLDLQGNIIEVNNMWLKTLGYTREEVIGKNMSEFLSNGWQVHFEESFPKFKCVGEVLGQEFELVKKDGKKILVSVQGRIGKDEIGNFKQTHCIFSDITLFRESEKRAKKLEAALLKAKKTEAIGRFAREIIHDLNNILTPMIFSVDMLELNLGKDSKEYEWIDRLRRAVDRATELVEEIHSFSGPINKDFHKFLYLQPIIDEVMNLIKFPHNITVVKDIDLFNEGIFGLPIKIYQIVLNLITNAIQAIDSNEGKIEIKLKLIDADKNSDYIPDAPDGLYSCLTIKDTGCGISKDTIDKIFEPFYTTKTQGTGLGLAVVDSLIKSMDGFICVDSEIGKGTKIRIYFPMIQSGVYI